MGKNTGITLVALVVTIVVLLIISGIAISMITGEEGLFAKANHSAQLYGEKSKSEAERVKGLISTLEKGTIPTLTSSNVRFNVTPKDGWTNTTKDGFVVVTIETDETGYDIEYSIDNGATWNPYPETGIKIYDNDTVVLARLTDGVRYGEVTGETALAQVANIDNEAPAEFTYNVIVTENTITVVGNTSVHEEETGQAPISYLYKLDNGNWQTSNQFTDIAPGSNHKVYMKAVDEAGNETNGTNGGNTELNLYVVHYEAGEGTGAPADQYKIYGSDLTLSNTEPTRSGYNFLGWAESSGATTADYSAGGTYRTNAAKTLYAVWEEVVLKNNITLAQAIDAKSTNTKVTIKAPLNAGETANQDVVIPAGFTLAPDSGNAVNEGIVIQDGEGNQFVWIPVEDSSSYTRIDFGKQGGSYNNYSETLPSDEADSINRNHGFYFGRYETGSKEDTEAKVYRSGVTEAKTVTIKKDQVPYDHVALNSSKAGSGKGNCIDLAASLGNGYRTTYGGTIKTKLCSSYAWDTALNFIDDLNWATGTGEPIIAQNYQDAPSFTYKYFEGAQIKTATKTAGTAINKAIATGQGVATKNIYDMGGNCVEITSELCSGREGQTDVIRGGYLYFSGFNYRPAGFRTNAYTVEGSWRTFRITLFV